MQQGTVKFFNEAKGFGFISPADGSKDVFVHSSGLDTRIIRENDKVVFDIQKGDRGFNAINVKLI
ncbi:cold-shock protein [Chryseobacterium potabilaquae]|uniref:Cold shock-like protein CspC n=1 Tax=Chryseobacterium potabilaquae TaxID=2675057 RepID=A0A6N4XBX4_9FLAO|nr:cold-shock protein [Chryseobacterium potabilaquae]CAA7197160.1 Cold shock-like protein CspC [Chryseobacterium potabilaquae]